MHSLASIPEKPKLIPIQNPVWFLIAALLLITQNWTKPKNPIGKYVNKLMYPYPGILLNNVREWTIGTLNDLDELQGHYAEREKYPIAKGHMLHNSVYVTFSIWQNYRAEKQISVCLWFGVVRVVRKGGWTIKGSTRKIFELMEQFGVLIVLVVFWVLCQYHHLQGNH